MSESSDKNRDILWYQNVYRGDTVKQLTLRAILMGIFLGGVMSLSNIYVGLKTGWGLGVTITACILSFAIFRTLRLLFPRFFVSDMTILENNCMQSTASAAGYAIGGPLSSGIAAYLMLTGHHIPWPILIIWTFFLAALGVFMAIPMKRQMINQENLRFPTGLASAEVLKSLHESNGIEAHDKARSLGISALLGALIAWLREVGKPFALPNFIPFPGKMLGVPLMQWTFSLELSAILMAAGAIIGWRVCWSLLLGGLINYLILAPWMASIGVIDVTHIGFRTIATWSTWTGASILVSSGLLQFASHWRTIWQAFQNLSKFFLPAEQVVDTDPLAAIEVPHAWFVRGVLISGIGCVSILHFAFGTSLWISVLAVLLTFFLSVVAARATGESDITPVGPMGKITQLIFGTLSPHNMTTNLMTGSLTAGAALASADLLTDLKSGYLLGANPRKQFLAQFCGIVFGTFIVVPAFYLIIPDPAVLGTELWPAPAAQVWATVAKIMSNGIHTLNVTAQIGMLCGAIVGIVLTMLEWVFPKKIAYIPSATGVGIAIVTPFFNSLSFFVGALVVLILEKIKPKLAEKYVIAVSSGIIAGESLLGVFVLLLKSLGIIHAS